MRTAAKKTVIGIAGHADAGKDLACTFFQAGCDDTVVDRIGLADKLKDVIADVAGIDRIYFHDRELKETAMTELNGHSPREACQKIGMMFRDVVGPDVWVNYAKRHLEADITVIPDTRFRNEELRFREDDSIDYALIRINRDGRDGNVGVENHASETSIKDLNPDFDIDNNGSKSDLSIQLMAILSAILTATDHSASSTVQLAPTLSK